MNRIEYMTKLASLLQDIPEVERRDAMKYYNDYFDEAGEENEEQVIREFGAPEEVAENIKADLKGKTENTTHGQQTAAGLALIGSGLIIMVLGVIATVGFGKLCEVVLRGLAKGMKYLWGKISHRKVVA